MDVYYQKKLPWGSNSKLSMKYMRQVSLFRVFEPGWAWTQNGLSFYSFKQLKQIVNVIEDMRAGLYSTEQLVNLTAILQRQWIWDMDMGLSSKPLLLLGLIPLTKIKDAKFCFWNQCSYIHIVAFTIATKSGFKLAPPTKLPGWVFSVQLITLEGKFWRI